MLTFKSAKVIEYYLMFAFLFVQTVVYSSNGFVGGVMSAMLLHIEPPRISYIWKIKKTKDCQKEDFRIHTCFSI